MRWILLLALLPTAAFAQSLAAIDADSLSKLNRSDPKFAEVRDGWAMLLQDEAREQRLGRMRGQLQQARQKLERIDATRNKVVQGIETITFTDEQIATRRDTALAEIVELQRQLEHLGKLWTWYQTGDSSVMGVGVDQLEGSPPPDEVKRRATELSLKLTALQQRLANPEKASAEEIQQLLQAMRNQATVLEQSRAPLSEAVRMLQQAIDREASLPALVSKSDREWINLHRKEIEALLK